MKAALQTASIREAITQNPRGALEKAAESGYRYLETVSSHFPGGCDFGLHMGSREGARLLNGLGPQVIGVHVSHTALDGAE